MQLDPNIVRYLELIPYFLSSFLIGLLIVPWIGRLAFAVGAVDLPPAIRSSKDETRNRRIHQHTPSLLGGVAMIIATLISLLIFGAIGQFPWGVFAGLAVILVLGYADDVYGISASWQLALQILAASLVVVSGVSITSVQVAGIFLDFNTTTFPIQIGDWLYNFIFPADLLTILWIVGFMNVMNWVGGVDGLHGAVSSIISVTVLLVAMKLGLIAPAIFLAAHVGGILGVLPYNYHLSKIFYGSAGDMGNGFVLAVMSILAGAKLPLFLIIAALPFFDALFVFLGRLSRNKSLIKTPWKILSINDKSHFHHRLLALGYGHKGVMFIESAITLFFCAMALYISDFRMDFLALAVAAGAMIVLLTSMSVMQSKNKVKHEKVAEQKAKEEAKKPAVNVVVRSSQSSDRYRY